MSRKTPAPHQSEVLSAISEAMPTQSRATVVMACGTGKTLVELWAARDIGAKRTVVFVPSLSLMQQVSREWREQNPWGTAFRPLHVCSDAGVGHLDDDEIKLRPEELDFPTCTHPGVVNEFLDSVDEEEGARAVVFCTYHSAKVLGDAMRVRAPNDRSFGVGIFDEAHKTVGDSAKTFSYALSDENVQIDKRLFFTATPRVVNRQGKRDEEGDLLVYSMDDQAVYGEQVYTLSFSEAASRDIIVPYRVVISVVDDAAINNEHMADTMVMADGQVFDAPVLANQIALRRALSNYGLNKAITFHSTVASAEQFARSGRVDLGRKFKALNSEYVSGEQRASDRDARMQFFRAAPTAVLSNARCLTEGVDVPAVDLVAFMDPKKSKVDIVQAAGRAMRKAGPRKSHGYILLPLHLNVHDGEPPEEALSRSDFSVIAEVLRALAENDEVLHDVVRDTLIQSGDTSSGSGRPVSNLEVDLGGLEPGSFSHEQLLRSIQTRIVRLVESGGDRFIAHMEKYVSQEGNAEVPQRFRCSDGYALGQTASKYRRHPDRLTAQQRERLTALGFRWGMLFVKRSPRDAADTFISYMERYVPETGRVSVPRSFRCSDGYGLGEAANKYRRYPDRLTAQQRERLTALGFRWGRRHIENDLTSTRSDTLSVSKLNQTKTTPFIADPHNDTLFKMWLKTHREVYGDCEVPRDRCMVDGYPLGEVLHAEKKAARRANYPQDRRDELQALGVQFEGDGERSVARDRQRG
jgi:superfamily II DNA or RNA helicase